MPRWWLAIVGLAGLAAGALTFLMPGLTALVLLTFIAVWAIVLGVMEIIGAIKLRKEIQGEWLLILNGAISVLFGGAAVPRSPARSRWCGSSAPTRSSRASCSSRWRFG